MKKRTLYIWGISISLVVLPLFLGFPSEVNGELILKDHTSVEHVSKLYYLLAKAFQILSIIGVLIFILGFLLLQKESGSKPSLIITSIDRDFFPKLYHEIKNDRNLILIFIIDLLIIICGVAV